MTSVKYLRCVMCGCRLVWCACVCGCCVVCLYVCAVWVLCGCFEISLLYKIMATVCMVYCLGAVHCHSLGKKLCTIEMAGLTTAELTTIKALLL